MLCKWYSLWEHMTALTYVVEAAGGQALGQMCGEQKSGEKSQSDVVVVKDVGVIVCAAFSFTQKNLPGYHTASIQSLQNLHKNEFNLFFLRQSKKKPALK